MTDYQEKQYVRYLSVVIPVYNEEENIDELFSRLKKTLDEKKYNWEVVFINDGSSDQTKDILVRLHNQNSEVKIIEFNRNYGQHSAVFAGFNEVEGEVVVVLDADLQNPPEEIPILINKLEEGYDVVSGLRENRQDSWFRKIPSFFMAKIISFATGVKMKDYGTMLRAYKREIIENVKNCQEISSYIPALANLFAKKVTEINVKHSSRSGGKSKYSFLKLLKLNFDFMTGFSALPIHFVSIMGLFVSFLGLGFGAFLGLRRLFLGDLPGEGGVFTLFAVLFVFMGIQIFSLGLIGEYIGRIYSEVRRRPRYFIKHKFIHR
ncbi:MAG: glycosyltransferase [Candidatus Aureabacteria bacterium]|nr:glycosyltransferase [Candidatus Auribacterota bacterium]